MLDSRHAVVGSTQSQQRSQEEVAVAVYQAQQSADRLPKVCRIIVITSQESFIQFESGNVAYIMKKQTNRNLAETFFACYITYRTIWS